MKGITKSLFDYDLGLGGVIAGCDEAGRGSLAGPLVCAACIMPSDDMLEGIDDSKKLSENKRETLYEQIIKRAISYRVSVIDVELIDRINILNATKRGMKEAIEALDRPDLVLVDAVKLDSDYNLKAIIKGDTLSYNIAAASIIAKVTRDRIMRSLHTQYPAYEFIKNKGYGTREHIKALKAHGATDIHRKTFIRGILDDKEQQNEY